MSEEKKESEVEAKPSEDSNLKNHLLKKLQKQCQKAKEEAKAC